MFGIAVVSSVLRYVLYALMPAAEWAVPIALLNGLTFATYWIGSVVYIDRIAPENLRSTGQTLLAAILGLASALGAPIGGQILDLAGGAVLFAIGAAVVGASYIFFRLGFNRESKAGVTD